jgi:hypothetical protein
MIDKVLAVLSLSALLVFTGIVVVFVRELDLAVVIVICLLIGAYDFWATLRKRKNGSGNGSKESG